MCARFVYLRVHVCVCVRARARARVLLYVCGGVRVLICLMLVLVCLMQTIYDIYCNMKWVRPGTRNSQGIADPTLTLCNTLQHTTTQAQDTVKASLIQASKGATKTGALEAVEVERGDGVFEVLGYIGRAVFEENYQQHPLTFETEANVEDAQTDE